MGLTQLSALANISSASLLYFCGIKPANSNLPSASSVECKVSAYEPSIPLDYVDKNENLASSQNSISSF